MGVVKEKGLVIRQSDFNDGTRQLTIFTEGYGIIRATNHGAKRQKFKSVALGQLMCYGEFDLFISNRDYASINNVNIIDAFLPAVEDIEKLSLCTYFADLTYAILGENNPDERLLKTLLNIIYALAYRDEPETKLKAVYELRAMCLEGYMPNLFSCPCGEEEVVGFDFDKGSMACYKCLGRNGMPVSAGVYKAMRYIAQAEDKRLLSFTGNDLLFKELGIVTEKYLLTHIDKKLPTLDYYKLIKNI